MIKAITFDCFGVLTESRWTAIMTSLEPNVRREVADIHHAYEKGFVDYSEYRQQVVQLAGLTPAEADDMFIYRKGYQKNQQLLDYIAQLSKDYKIGVLSNAGTGWLRDTFLNEAEVTLFDDMVLSFEVGLIKPDPAIYELACQRLGAQPPEVILVDDQPGYCQVARQVGMKAIVYEDFASFTSELQSLLADANN